MQIETYNRNHAKAKTETFVEEITDRDELLPFKFPVTFPQQKPVDGMMHSVHVTAYGFSEDHARKRLLKMSMEDVIVGIAIKG